MRLHAGYRSSKLRLQLRKARRPNPTLPRRQYPLRIQRILDRLIEPHLRIVIPIVRLRDLIHERQMRPVLAPAQRRAFRNQIPDQLLRLPPLRGVLAIEDDLDDVVHLAQADGEGAHVVEARGVAALLHERELPHRVVARDLADGREGNVGAVGEPVDPAQLFVAGDALEHVVAVVEHAVFLDVLGEEELRACNGGEGFFDESPVGIADLFRPLQAG